MSLVKPFRDSVVCAHGKSLNDLAIGKVSCQKCEAEAIDKIQTLPVHSHFINAFFHLVNFEILLFFGALVVGVGMSISKVVSWLKPKKTG